jgi:hypothetical protein
MIFFTMIFLPCVCVCVCVCVHETNNDDDDNSSEISLRAAEDIIHQNRTRYRSNRARRFDLLLLLLSFKSTNTYLNHRGCNSQQEKKKEGKDRLRDDGHFGGFYATVVFDDENGVGISLVRILRRIFEAAIRAFCRLC